MAFEAGEYALVSVGLGGPSAAFGVVSELVDVSDLGLEGRGEIGRSDVVGAGLADVGVAAGFGGEISGAVAVRDAGLEHLGSEPLDAVGNGGAAGCSDGDAAGDLAGDLVVGGFEGYSDLTGKSG